MVVKGNAIKGANIAATSPIDFGAEFMEKPTQDDLN